MGKLCLTHYVSEAMVCVGSVMYMKAEQARIPAALVLDFDNLDCPPWEYKVF